MIVVDQEGENLTLYGCGGQQSFFFHIGAIASRQRTSDAAYISKVEGKFKALEFKLEGMAITNQNCPPN